MKILIQLTGITSILISIFLIDLDTQQKDLLFDPGTSPDGREEHRLMMRGGAVDQQIVNDTRNFIKLKIDQNTKKQFKDAGIGTWEELGPGNFSGRIRAIAVHPSNPSIIYVGGSSGGVWKSINGGASWTPISDFLASLSITSIVIDPVRPDTMYVSTGEAIVAGPAINGTFSQANPGAGIFRSIDGGTSWQLLPAIINDPANNSSAGINKFYWVSKVVLDPDDPSILFAATFEETKNLDQGLTLSAKVVRFSGYGQLLSHSSSPVPGKGLDIEVKSGSDTLFLGTSNSLAYIFPKSNLTPPSQIIFPNTPGVDTLNRIEFALAPNDPSTVYALCQGDSDDGFLYKSTDGGASWTDMNLAVDVFLNGSGINQGWYNNTIWVDPGFSPRLIIGGINLWRSMDGGVSFTKISDASGYLAGTSAHADHHIIVETSDYNMSTNRKVYFGNDGGIVATDDWLSVSENSGWDLKNGTTLGTIQFYASDVRRDSIIGGSQDNGTMLSTDRGVTWSHLWGGDGGYCAITGEGHTYLSTQFGNYIRLNGTDTFRIASLNGAINIQNCNGGAVASLSVQDNPSFIAPLKVFENDGNKICVAGERLWYSDDAGCTFTDVSPRAVISGERVTAIEIDATGSTVFVGYSNGDLYRDNSSGSFSSWQYVGSAGIFGDRVITDIAIAPDDINKILISTGGYYDDNIWVSEDGGTSWSESSTGFPSLHINTLTWHLTKSGWIYAGTDLGILASENGGQEWAVSPNIMGVSDGPVFAEITELKFGNEDTYGRRKLYATTYGRGVWVTEKPIQSKIYVDNQCTPCGIGIQSIPFATFEEAVAVAAHGQTIVIKGGVNYDVSAVQVLEKRVTIEIDSGPVVID